MARTGAVVYLLALAVAPLTGWSIEATILVTGIVMTVYTFLGGIVAVVWTGVLQSAVLVAGTIVCLAAVLLKTPGGPTEIVRAGAADGKFSLGSLGGSLSESTFWVVFAYGIVMNLGNFATDQSYVQRYITARDDREAKKGVWLTTLLYVPTAAVFFFVGTGLYVFYYHFPDLLGTGTKPDEVFPHFIAHELPVGFAGLVIAAIFAASMDSNLNSMATLTYCDVYQRYFRPRAGEREAMMVLRAATVAWGILCTGVALWMIQATKMFNVLDVWWDLAGIFSGGILGLFLLGFLSSRVTSRMAAVAVTIGVLFIVWATFSPKSFWPESWSEFRSPLHNLLTVVVGTLVILAIGLAGTLVSRPSSDRPT
jgi:SSS family solute:Na+ symporter